MRRLWLAMLGSLVLAGVVWAGVAQARIDRSYGENGVVVVQPPVPIPWRSQVVRQVAAAHDGSAYALLERSRCEPPYYNYCGVKGYALVRYSGNGSLDSYFGGSAGFYELPFENRRSTPVLVVDSAGRPVVAQSAEDEVTIVRLTPDGSPDATFGNDGVVSFQCGSCEREPQLIKGPRGSLTVVSSRRVYGSSRGNGRSGTIVGLIRLRGDGSFDERFGAAGSTTVGLPNTRPFAAAVAGKGGALYLAGEGCCKSARRGYLVRISAKGHYDRRFAKATGQALRAVNRFGSLGQSVNAVLLRSHGRIDLLGSAGYDRGFMLRLNRYGRAIRKFARKGLRSLPLPIGSAVHGSEGATMLLSNANLRGVAIVMRMGSGGRMDRRFGREVIPESEGRTGIAIASLARRRLLVLSLGLEECRQYCSSTAELVRYAE